MRTSPRGAVCLVRHAFVARWLVVIVDSETLPTQSSPFTPNDVPCGVGEALCDGVCADVARGALRPADYARGGHVERTQDMADVTWRVFELDTAPTR